MTEHSPAALATLLIVTVLVLGARASDHPCQGLPIAGVTMEGCADQWCDDPSVRAQLLSLTDIRPKEFWDEARLRNAKARLEQTGFFRAVEEHCQMRGEGDVIFVLLRVFPHTWIRAVHFDGNSALDDSELKKRLFLRPGRYLNHEDEVGKEELVEQAERLQRLYQREGYDETAVAIQVDTVDRDQVELTVNIVEGQRKRVTAIDVRINVESGEPPPNKRFGPNARCPKYTDRTIRLASGLSTSQAFTDRKSKNARRALRKYLRQRGVPKPGVKVEYDPATQRAALIAEYNRCWLIRFQLRQDEGPPWEGYASEDRDDLWNAMSFGESGAFTLDEAERSRGALEALYQSQGYLLAKVVLDFRRADGRTSDPGVRGVISFYITLGYKSEIRNIAVTGSTVFSESTLLDTMGTRTYDFFGSGGYLIIKQLFKDLERIRGKYRARGYYKMGFEGAAKKSVDRVHVTMKRVKQNGEVWLRYTYTYREFAFHLKKQPNESVLYLEVGLEEGPLSRMGAVELDAPDRSEIVELIKLQPNAPYVANEVGQDRARMLKYYQQKGHFLVSIETTCTGHGEGRDILDKCDWRSVLARKVDVKHTIIPGPRVSVGEVFARGMELTRYELVRDPLPNPGELLDRVQVDRAEQQIRELSVFDRVDIRFIGLEEKPVRDKVAIVVSVHEDTAQHIDIDGGFEPVITVSGDEQGTLREEASVQWLADLVTDGLSVTNIGLRGLGTAVPLNIPSFLITAGITYRHKNVAGLGFGFRLPVRYGFTIPDSADNVGRAFSRLVQVQPEFRHRNIFGTGADIQYGINASYDTATGLFDTWKLAPTATVGWRFLEERLRLSMSVEGGAIKTSETAFPAGLYEGEPVSTFATLDVRATYDRLDNPIHPFQGFSVSGRAKLAFSDDPVTDSATFLKLEASAMGVFNIRRFLVGAVYARFATSVGNQSVLPDHELYFLGGAFGIRGLPDSAVYAVDGNGNPLQVGGETFRGGNTLLMGTLEFRHPILRRDSFQLWAAYFYDWGALALNPGDLTTKSIRMTAGAGIRLLVGGIPVRIDVGFNVDPRCKAPPVGQAALNGNRCTAGKEDLFETQFALLYSF